VIARDQAELRRHVYALLEPTSAAAILDVGCGRGQDLAEIGGLVGPQALLAGIDLSESSIGAARALGGSDGRFAFVAGDVSAGLPYDDCSFDRVLSLNLLECIPDKQALLAEVHRVLRPRGLVVAAHFDWDSQLLDGEDKELVRTIVHSFADWKQMWMADADAWMGRRLWRTFQRSGLFEGSVHAALLINTRYEAGAYGWERVRDYHSLVRQGKIGEAEYERFRAAIEKLAARDEFLYSITMFIYVGTKLDVPGRGASG
jgi:ubiquinone/menaquinone biosynthesis C-methylase UbiE